MNKIGALVNSFTSYQLQDFIPFTAEVYFRLLERLSETLWPIHLFSLALGVAALVLVLKNQGRLACLLMAPVWAFVATVFFMRHYAQLNWAGHYVGYAFLVQAILLLLLALTGFGRHNRLANNKPVVVIATVIVVSGLVAQPLMTPLSGGSWWQAQVFGIHADPTAITTIGLALMLLRGWRLWLIAIIPILWLLLSFLTMWVLEAAQAWLLFAVLVSITCCIIAVWASARRKCSR